jgi:hypothetical protein
MASEKAKPVNGKKSPDNSSDPDATLQGATKIDNSDLKDGSEKVSGTLSDPNDVDLFRIHLNAGDQLEADTDARVFNGPDTVLALFDNKGNVITVNDDFDGFDSRIFATAEKSGNYYLGVSSYANFPEAGPTYEGFGNSQGPYDLNILIA